MDEVNPPYLIPIFISAALVLRNSSVIKSLRDIDIATMHQALSRLPAQQDSLEPWLKDSLKLMKAYKGRESELMRRGVEVKHLQNQLWNEDSNNNTRRSRRANRGGNNGVLASVGRFIFVTHRWYTVAIAVLGAAYFIHSKYGNGFEVGPQLKASLEKYLPDCFKSVIKALAGEFEFE
jgi:hypothetical protein